MQFPPSFLIFFSFGEILRSFTGLKTMTTFTAFDTLYQIQNSWTVSI